MRSSILIAVLLAVAVQSWGRVLFQTPAEEQGRLSIADVEMMLGQWELSDTQVRVPDAASPSGVSYWTGFSADVKVKALTNDTAALAGKSNLELSSELERMITTADSPNTGSSEFIIVSCNPVTGATLGYNLFAPQQNTTRVRVKRIMGISYKTTEGVVWKAGEQTSPASWDIVFSPRDNGEWEMRATRLMPYQLTNAQRNTTIVERQSLMAMGPYLKSNATLSEVLPALAPRILV